LPEMALKNTEAIGAALKAAEPLSAAEALDGALHQHRMLVLCWAKADKALREGVTYREARELLGLIVGLAGALQDVLCQLASAEAGQALTEAARIGAEAQGTLDLLAAQAARPLPPPSPLPPGFMAEAKAAWQRGEGQDAEEVLARRKAAKR
jgi:hypothetical protein